MTRARGYAVAAARALGVLAVAGMVLAGCGRRASDLPLESRGTSAGVIPPRIVPEPLNVPLPFYAARPRAETPYTRSDLLRNFLSIALRAEAADDLDAEGGISISKWQGPVRYRLAGAQPRDRVQIAALSQRLGQLTGLDIREALDAERYNMDIRFVPRAYRGVEIQELLATDWLGPSVTALATNWRDHEFDRCFTLTTRHPSTGVTGTAHIFIKDELSPIWRETCIIEEMAQSLGLLNDDPRANPSIFNDDGAYQSLTSHDELLLQVLYDPRIMPGMRHSDVVPLAEEVIADLTRGSRT